MRDFIRELKQFFRKGDMVLLILCLATSAIGCVIIASVTNAPKFGNSLRYIGLQIASTLLGLLAFAVFSSIDADTFSEHRRPMVALNLLLLLMLIPFGTDNNTGNRSWLDFPLLPFNIQPAEICKITYIIIMASVMSSHQNRISSIPSVMHMVFHLGLLFGVNMVLSSDMGVSLIFVFIFIGMTFAGGVHKGWFLTAISGIVAGLPILWNYILQDHQRNRFLVLFDPSVDANATGIRWHSNQALLSLTGGGFYGQGLYNGRRTTVGGLKAQHTDYIFSAIGEELGFIGCMAIIILEFAIIARIIYVGIRTPDFARRVVCFGAAAALIFQVTINIGMNLGVMPVIGLTLPFISYGGSSMLSLYAMLGLVSGVCARPTPGKQGLYVQPPR